MSIDFAALTQAVVAGLSDVRSCLMVSRDGLALGAFPATEEGRTLEVWTRIAALGDVERGFVTIRDEVWVFCRRGAYGALATAPSTARPGVILDSLEQMVLKAEESRVRKEGLPPAAEREAPVADYPHRRRTMLHRDRSAALVRSEERLSSEAQEIAVSAWAKRLMEDENLERAAEDPGSATSETPPEISVSPPSEALLVEPTAEAEAGGEEGPRGSSREHSLIDRVELSREFAAILAETEEEEE
jgi:hypothetical protein